MINRRTGHRSHSYRIRIEGGIEPTWSDRLGGLRIRHWEAGGEAGGDTSTLEGVLADPAALAGVLATLHDLNITLISVEKLDETEKRSGQ